jgi:uncharacterized membrane protein YedE/YeeE
MTTMSPTEKTTAAQDRSMPKQFANPYVGGALLGLVLFSAFYLTGNGLGASGGLNRMIIGLVDVFAPLHVDRVAYLVNYAGGDKNALDHWIVLMTVGIFLGGLLSGWFGNRLRIETIKGPRISVHQRWLFAFGGGIITGFGARLARGCTSGQGLSGAATLSVGSWAFLMAFFAGGYMLAYALRRLWT